MKNLLLTIGLIIALIFTSNAQSEVSLGDKKLPIVELTLNGKKAKFLLDTGASYSLIGNNISDDYKVTFSITDEYENIVGVGNQNEKLFRVNKASFELDGKKLKGNFKARSMDYIVNHVYNTYNEEIIGIIGMDVLKANKCIIDIKNNKLIFPNLK